MAPSWKLVIDRRCVPSGRIVTMLAESAGSKKFAFSVTPMHLDEASATLASRLAIAAADEDTMEPRFEPVGIPDRGEVTPGGDERFLRGIRRSVRVAEDKRRDRVQPADRGRRQYVERLTVAGHRGSDQLSIHRPSGSRTSSCLQRAMGEGSRKRFPNPSSAALCGALTVASPSVVRGAGAVAHP